MILGRFGSVHAFASIGRVTEFASVGIIRGEIIPIRIIRSKDRLLPDQLPRAAR
jgi:hypothetical protein